MIEFLVNPLEESSAASAGSAPEEDALGRADFLRMLVAQLENQDPLNPQDGTEFTAQLAQFSSLEQLIAMRESVEALSESQNAGQLGSLSLAAVGIIGREALVEAEAFEVAGGRVPPLAVDLSVAADNLTVEVLNSANQPVATWRQGATPAGRLDLDWAELSEGDGVLADGVYRVRVKAVADLIPQPAQSLVRGRVTATTLAGDEPRVHVGPAVVPFDRVREVFEAEAAQ